MPRLIETEIGNFIKKLSKEGWLLPLGSDDIKFLVDLVEQALMAYTITDIQEEFEDEF